MNVISKVFHSVKKERQRRRRSNLLGLSKGKIAKRKLQEVRKQMPKALKLVNPLTKTNMLHRACERGNEEETRNLIKNLTSSQLLIRDASGETALYIAINHGKNLLNIFLLVYLSVCLIITIPYCDLSRTFELLCCL